MLGQLQKNIREKTTMSYLCSSDLRFHSRGNVTKINLKSRNQNYLEHLIINDGTDDTLPVTVNEDSHYYICTSCHRSLIANHIPRCNEKRHQFILPDLPDELTTDEMKLNKCEAHLLKLIIPFIRVAHIPRSSEFKVMGPVINVEADVTEIVEKILPIDQDLIPVALKRRPEYKGSYIEEVISKKKLMKYFLYFRTANPLFAEVEFDENTLDQIIEEYMVDIERQDEWKSQAENTDDEDSDDANVDDEEPEVIDVNEEVTKSDHNEEQNLPEYLTEVASDTVIDPMTHIGNRKSVSEFLANAIIQNEQISKSKSKRMQKVPVAPSAASRFTDWETAEHLEEKAFPHLFPTGTGGYLSSHQENGVSFASYIKQRIFGMDPRFRNDTTYLFFLFIVKESIEIKRCNGTFFRKGKANKSKYTVDFLLGCEKAEVERHDVQYKAFKAIRGTDPYFQHQKTKLMAMIRQLGAPHLFLTLSAAEVHWFDLIRSLYLKETGNTLTDAEIKEIPKPELNKLISHNTVDTTAHFNHRIQVIFTALKKPGILSTYKVVDYFYRVEFQQRGAPHIHSVLWIENDDGSSPKLYDGSDESKEMCTALVDSVISGQIPNDDDPLHEKVSFFQTHNHTFTCRKKE